MTALHRHQTTSPVPEAVAYVADLMSGFRRTWFLCGGWAVDAWLGHQTRDHGDVDVVVFHDDHPAIFEHLAGWELIGHDPNVAGDTTESWNGRTLDLPAHIHVPRSGSSLDKGAPRTHAVFEFEFLLNERSDHDWIFNREPRISLPLRDCAELSLWGLPTAVPEAVLFYKAGGDLPSEEIRELRPHDELDFRALLPKLTDKQRSWLQEAISLVHPAHPWLTELGR